MSAIKSDTVFVLRHAQLVHMPADQIASLWRKYLDAFATCLLHWGGDPRSPSGQRLERLYWEAGVLWGSDSIAAETSFLRCVFTHCSRAHQPACRIAILLLRARTSCVASRSVQIKHPDRLAVSSSAKMLGALPWACKLDLAS